MDIEFECPSCQQPLAVDQLHAGLEASCPHCQSTIAVPAATMPAVAAAGVVATRDQPAEDDAQFLCTNPECGGIWTEGQLLIQATREKSVKLCPKCRRAVERVIVEPSFWARLPGAFAYPFRQQGVWIVLLGTPVLLANDLAGFGILLILVKLILLGLIGSFLINVIQTTADDPETPLEWPDASDKGDLLVTGLQLVGSVLLVFAPAILCAFRTLSSHGENPGAWAQASAALAILGLLYYPMAFLAFAMFDSLNGLNPLIVLPSILKAPLQYLTILILIAAMIVGRHLLGAMCVGLSIGWKIACLFPLEVVAFYSLIVSARLLALLYRSKAAGLGWFE